MITHELQSVPEKKSAADALIYLSGFAVLTRNNSRKGGTISDSHFDTRVGVAGQSPDPLESVRPDCKNTPSQVAWRSRRLRAPRNRFWPLVYVCSG